MALSIDLRERVVFAYVKGEGSVRGLARRFKIGKCSVQRWVKRYKESDSLKPQHGGGWKPLIDEGGLVQLAGMVEAEPDATVAELRDKYAKLTGIEVSTSTIGRALARLGLTRKKRPCTPASGIPRG